MASASHLKALLQSHLEGDDSRFYSVAMQVAAHEAKLGHGKLALELRALVDQAKSNRHNIHKAAVKPIPLNQPRGELAGLIMVTYPKTRLGNMVLDENLTAQIMRIIKEQKRASEILSHGLSPRRKLLLMGKPGTGKTMTASVLASELGLPLFQVRLDGLVTKYMGETAAKLRQVFNATEQTRGIYLFDEFDAIGSQRGLTNDVGEARRILNGFLQMIEQDESHSLIVAATNHPEILDHALFRRFDDVLDYRLPDINCITHLLKLRLGKVTSQGISWEQLAKKAEGLSFAEVTRAANEAIKGVLIEGRKQVTDEDVGRMIGERQLISRQLDNAKSGHKPR